MAYILRKVEEAKAAYLMEMAKSANAGKSKGKTRDGSSSQGGGEAQAAEESAEGNIAGQDAVVTTAKELQKKEEEVGKVAEPEEWLAAGPQAPELDLEQRTRKRVAAGPATKKVKKTTTKASKAEAACRQSPRLVKIRAPSTRRAVIEDGPNSSSSSSSSQDSSSSDPTAPRRAPLLPESSAPVPPRRRES